MKKCETGEVQRLHCDKMDEMDEEMNDEWRMFWLEDEDCRHDAMQNSLKGKGYEGKQRRGKDSVYLMPMAMSLCRNSTLYFLGLKESLPTGCIHVAHVA